MATLDIESELDVSATAVRVTNDELTVDLEDGRTISVPLGWYPRLRDGTAAERAKVRLSPCGIHWPDLDEDISIRGLLLGLKSGESSESLKFWLDERKKGRTPTLADFVKHRRQTSATARKAGKRKSA
jgi:hypothetical protein